MENRHISIAVVMTGDDGAGAGDDDDDDAHGCPSAHIVSFNPWRSMHCPESLKDSQ